MPIPLFNWSAQIVSRQSLTASIFDDEFKQLLHDLWMLCCDVLLVLWVNLKVVKFGFSAVVSAN